MKIKKNTILTIDQYINEALYNNKFGYYMKNNPFGKNGDYITSPNISILFSEMIAIWIISFWENLKYPKKFNLIELGGGNGEMIKQILNTFENFPLFQNCCKIHILEKSTYLKNIQKQNLKNKNIKWLKNLNEISNRPNIFIANEFFDALPIKQFIKKEQKWYERNIKFSKINKPEFLNILTDIKKFEKIKNIFINYKNLKIKKNKRKIIFILGMPRSGTSLTEQILSSHNNVFGGGELPFIPSIINKNFLQDKNIKIFNEIKDLEKILNNSQDEYLSQISSIDNSEKSFTDKTPLNFKYIGFLINIFPNIKIINCKRNPVDICWSNFKNYFGASLNFSNDLEDLAQYYNQYESIMKFWKKYFSNSIYDLNYENLVTNSEEEIKNLIKFCELNWDPNCLKHYENKRLIKTVSFNQARKPIYKSAIKSSNMYEKYLDKLVKNFNF